MYELGRLFYNRGIIEQDYAEARRWYGKAAALGNAEAQFALGTMHEEGKGGPQNRSAAKEWFGRACEGDHHIACVRYRKLDKAGY